MISSIFQPSPPPLQLSSSTKGQAVLFRKKELTPREISFTLKECKGRCLLSIFFLDKSMHWQCLTLWPWRLWVLFIAFVSQILCILFSFLDNTAKEKVKKKRCYLKDFLELYSHLIQKVPQKWEGRNSYPKVWCERQYYSLGFDWCPNWGAIEKGSCTQWTTMQSWESRHLVHTE